MNMDADIGTQYPQEQNFKSKIETLAQENLAIWLIAPLTALDIGAVHRPECIAQALEFPASPAHLNRAIISFSTQSNVQHHDLVLNDLYLEPIRLINGHEPPKRFFRTFWASTSRRLLLRNQQVVWIYCANLARARQNLMG